MVVGSGTAENFDLCNVGEAIFVECEFHNPVGKLNIFVYYVTDCLKSNIDSYAVSIRNDGKKIIGRIRR